MQQPLPTPFVTMEPASKKCKANAKAIAAFESTSQLIPKDTRKIFKPFTTKQLLESYRTPPSSTMTSSTPFGTSPTATIL
ncbi:hypothetical protein AAC387_Pa12g0855 [Persea americana]